jgi:hypothetical protein
LIACYKDTGYCPVSWPTSRIPVASSDLELSATTAVHPDAKAVEAPGLPFDARCIALLFEKTDSASRLGTAKVLAEVVWLAGYYLATCGTSRLPSASSDFELGAAAAVNPDAVAVEAPGLPFDARCIAKLFEKTDPASRVGTAKALAVVVWFAGDYVREVIIGWCGEITAWQRRK